MSCRKVKILGIMMIANVFVYIMVEVTRSGNQDKTSNSKVRIPDKQFWKKPVPSEAYWNREQQGLDLLYNPVLTALNSTSSTVEASLNVSQLTPCEPDLGVMTQVKDFNSLPERFKDFLLYMKCRTYPLVVNQPRKCKDKPFLLLAIKSLTPHFDRRQAIRESWGKKVKIGNYTVVTVFLLGKTTSMDHFPDLSEMLRYKGFSYIFHGYLCDLWCQNLDRFHC
ncbi:UNVERIFIED_CONTAM: hypothetical protein FKN15_072814 [Acipenser sinensis]